MSDFENNVPFLNSLSSYHNGSARFLGSRDHYDGDPLDSRFESEENMEDGGANNSSHHSRQEVE